ncbi:unnamed protein product [Mytilus coruscus]|uniref:Uncharacterized protein n=1 Tax=Mytilus coruscus TaxID=42192 RepID=A0A6J8D808_MYTCO|nr:unnamed protein product [Mytilus coruscus]
MPDRSSCRTINIEEMPDKSSCRTINIEEMPDRSSCRTINIEEMPDRSSCRTINIEEMPDKSSCRTINIEEMPDKSSCRTINIEEMPDRSSCRTINIVEMPDKSSCRTINIEEMPDRSSCRTINIEEMPDKSSCRTINIEEMPDRSSYLDSEAVYGQCECEDPDNCSCSLFTIPVRAVFIKHAGVFGIRKLDAIRQRKGEAEMAQADWLRDVQHDLHDGECVVNYVTSADIDTVVIQLFTVSLYWPRNVDNTFKFPVYVWLQKTEARDL